MRIGITSDIHTDISPANENIIKYLADIIKHSELDALIIAGDISPFPIKFSQTISELSDPAYKTIFVAGNHDIWLPSFNSTLTSYNKYELITAICKEHNAHHLGDSPLIIDNIGFCGTIGWYDYSFKLDKYQIPERCYIEKTFGGSIWNDVNFANWRNSDKEVAKSFENDLQNQINSIKDNVSRIIVATHHIPFRECVTYRNELSWDFFSAFMGSNGLGDICLNEPLVTHAIFGHTHSDYFMDIKRDGYHKVTAICSPIGYLTDPPKNLAEYAKNKLKIINV